MKKVLCICTRDVSRAPMIAVLLSEYLKNCGVSGVSVSSAGVRPGCGGQPANEMATEVMVMEGTVYGDHMRNYDSVFIGDLDLTDYDFFIFADDTVRDFFMEMYQCHDSEPRAIHVIGGGDSIIDPFGLGRNAYELCLELIKSCLSEVAYFVTQDFVDGTVAAELQAA